MTDEYEQSDQTPAAEEIVADSGDELDEIVESLSAEEAPAEEIAEPEAPIEAEPVADPEPADSPETPVEETAESAEPESADETRAAPAEPVEVTETAAATLDLPAKPKSPIPWWPFLCLIAAWVVLCAAAAYFLTRNPDIPSLRQDAYTFIVAAGLAFTILGPVLSIAVWSFVRGGIAKEQRAGLFVSSLVRAAVITFVGVLAWTGTLIFIDSLRLGLIRF